MRAEATFIAVEVQDEAAADAAIAAKLTEACPVDIFAQESDGSLRIVQENLDECVLCRLCIDATDSFPTRPVNVVKLYDAGALLA
jgi:ferredoxin-like protein FixX